MKYFLQKERLQIYLCSHNKMWILSIHCTPICEMPYYELYMIFHAEVTKISRRNCVIKDARIICQSFNTLSPGNQDTPPFV